MSVCGVKFFSVVGCVEICVFRKVYPPGGLRIADWRRRPADGSLADRRAPVEALWISDTLGGPVSRVAGENARRSPRDAAWLRTGDHFVESDVAFDGLRRRRPRRVRQVHLRNNEHVRRHRFRFSIHIYSDLPTIIRISG